jgi:hypothetical protein
MNDEDTESTELDLFTEELWDAVCRLRVGSGLSSMQVLQGVETVRGRVALEIRTERECDLLPGS